jgi:hypothetical protein
MDELRASGGSAIRPRATLLCAGQVGPAEPLGDDARESMLPGRGQHPLRLADEVPRRPPADAVIEPELEQQLARGS